MLSFGIYFKKPSSAEDLFELLGELNGYKKTEWGYEKNNVVLFDSEENNASEKVYDAVKNEIINVLQIKLK